MIYQVIKYVSFLIGMVESSASKHSEHGEENETHNGKEN